MRVRQSNELVDFTGLRPVEQLERLDASKNRIETLNGLERVCMLLLACMRVRSSVCVCQDMIPV